MKVILSVVLLALVFSTLIVTPAPAQAWGPNTHIVLSKRAIEEAEDSIIKSQIQAYPEAYMCGVVFPDIAVLYYYTQFESYRSTHNWLFYHRLLEEATTTEEKVFAYGVATHLIQDTIAHNEYTPLKIRQTLGSNLYTHPLVEASVEAGNFDLTTSGSLENMEKFLPLVNRVLGRDVSDMSSLFRTILRAGGFYQEAYATPNAPFWDIYGLAAKFAQNLYGTQDAAPYLTEATDLTVSFIESGATPLRDPTGITELGGAGFFSDGFRFIVTFIVALLAIALISRRMKKK
jgi:hypothetical protein